MTVYVIGCEGSSLVKIGYTAGNPKARLNALQSGCPLPVKLLWQSTPEYGKKLEQYLHWHFGRYHHHGEWF